MKRKRLPIIMIMILYFVVFSSMGYVLHVVVTEYGEALGVVCAVIFVFGMCTVMAIYELSAVFKLWKKLYG